jgi:hypothetical protein
MFGKRFGRMAENTRMVNSILKMDKVEDMHSSLDPLVNSVRIFYSSREDFVKNYPAKDNLQGKIGLIISRRE